jgi:hypothetical protein
MRIGLGRGLFVLGWGIAVISGCDRSPAPPPQTADAMPAPATRPTADELMSAERTQLDINSAPLSIKLPTSWKIVMVDGVSVLEGPTPSGETTITIATLPGMSSHRIDLLVEGAEADAQKRPDRVQVHDLHQVNGLRAFDKIAYTGPSTQPSTQPAGTSAPPSDTLTSVPLEPDSVVSGPMVSWSRLVFVPFQDAYLPCSFSIASMTPGEYSQDQAFLQSLLDSAQSRQLQDLQ